MVSSKTTCANTLSGKRCFTTKQVLQRTETKCSDKKYKTITHMTHCEIYNIIPKSRDFLIA